MLITPSYYCTKCSTIYGMIPTPFPAFTQTLNGVLKREASNHDT